MHRRIPMLVLLFSLVISASAQTAPQRQLPMGRWTEPPFVEITARLATDLKGGGMARRPRRSSDVPDLTRLSQRNDGTFPAAHVRTAIMTGTDDLLPGHGARPMPSWGAIFHEIEFDQDLGNVRLENVTKYIESIQQK